MLVDLMKSKFVRRMSVASIISEPIACISFKFWLLLTLGYMPRHVWNLQFIFDILRIYFVKLKMEPMGEKMQNATPPTNRCQKIQTSDFFPVGLKKICLGWNFNGSFFFFFVFVNIGPSGSEISKRHSYKSLPKVLKFVWIFLPLILTKLRWRFLKFWVSDLTIFFSQIRFTIIPYVETKTPN